MLGRSNQARSPFDFVKLTRQNLCIGITYDKKGTKIIAKILALSFHPTEGGELESGVKDVLKVWMNKFSKQRIAVYGVVVASLFVLTANIYDWIIANPPFVQTTPNFSAPTSLYY